jgi:site-specific DNA-cytosine methylase
MSWIPHVKKMLKGWAQTGTLYIGSGCGATLSEATVCEDMDILYKITCASEIDPKLRRFIKDNFQVEHLYEQIGQVPDGSCDKCVIHKGKHCVTIVTKEHIYVAGLPCQPYSSLRKNRFTEDESPLKTRQDAIDPLEGFTKHVNSRMPDFCIGENVEGMAKRKRNEDKTDMELMLEHLEKECPAYYWVKIRVNAADWTKMTRNRIYILGMKKTLGHKDILEQIQLHIWQTEVAFADTGDKRDLYDILALSGALPRPAKMAEPKQVKPMLLSSVHIYMGPSSFPLVGPKHFQNV